MDRYIEKYLRRVKGTKSEGTYSQKRTALRQYDEWAAECGYDDLTAMDALDIEEYFIWLNSEGYAPNTVAVRFEAVRTLYNALAGKFGVIEENPFENLRRRDYVDRNTRKHDEADIVYVSEKEKEAMCENVPSPRMRNELIIRMLWQTGIRKSELREIELDDINRNDRSVRVWSPKTKTSRAVFYQPRLDFYLEQWLDRGYRDSYKPAKDSSYLFLTERSRKLGEATVNDKIVKPAAEAAGIQEVMYTDKAGNKRVRVTAHSLRHGHAVHALKNDVGVRFVQQHLGHADLEMTMKYLQLIDDDVRDAYAGFGESD